MTNRFAATGHFFSGHWGTYCRVLNPVKQGMVKSHAGTTFSLIEVNPDESRDSRKPAMEENGHTSRC
jgi:hypothetical protein